MDDTGADELYFTCNCKHSRHIACVKRWIDTRIGDKNRICEVCTIPHKFYINVIQRNIKSNCQKKTVRLIDLMVAHPMGDRPMVARPMNVQLAKIINECFDRDMSIIRLQSICHGDAELYSTDYGTIGACTLNFGDTVTIEYDEWDACQICELNPHSGGLYQITVKRLPVGELKINIDTQHTVKQLQCEIQKQSGIQIGQQRLVLGTETMDPVKTLGDYNVTNDMIVRLFIVLRGD
jgi:hypothetical protein